MANRWGNGGNSGRLYFWGLQNHCSHEIKRRLLLGRKVMTNLDSSEFEWTLGDGDRQGGLACCDSWGRKESDMTERLNWTELRQHIKKQRHYFANKGPSSQSYGFSSSHVWMWELDHKEGWVPKNWCFWTVMLEKTLESLLDCKEIQPVHSKGNQSWTFIGGTDAEAEIPILWPPDVKNWLPWKDPDARRDWKQEEKGTTEDEMVGWHHRFNGCELELLRELVMDREAWCATVYGVAKSWTILRDWIELNSVGGFPSLYTLSSIYCLWSFWW